MMKLTRYCPRCDQEIEVDQSESKCPQCGDPLSSWIDKPTIDLVEMDQDFSLSLGDPFAVEPDSSDELLGQKFADYQIETFLGQGGMARVYLATHLSLQRPCAIKVIRPSLLEQGDRAIESFLSEARLSAAINHPNAVTLHTLGHSEGRHFLELEYVDGKSLGRVISERGPIDPLQATTWMYQISSALAAAHDLNMIHRDIKPANVMVTKAQSVKLADFGLAKQVAADRDQVGEVLSGTPSYMAPELFNGKAASTQSDVYAMGVTYYCLLTGRLPIDIASIGELVRFHSKNDLLGQLDLEQEQFPAGVINVLRQSLGRDAGGRYEHGSELRDELRAALGGLRSVESLLIEGLAGTSLEPEFDGERYHIRVKVSEGRTQNVSVENVKDAETNEEIIRVFSICCPTEASYYERALKLNAAMSHGAIGIETFSATPHFVIVNSYPRATCDPQEIRTSVLELAKYADHVENLLTGQDQY